MPEEVKSHSDTECAMCGRDGGPVPECEICQGTAQSRPRAFTLTEERQGAESDPDRYGRTGNVSPKIVNLPGSFNPNG